jgi:Protein of unknown function (DUF3179)
MSHSIQIIAAIVCCLLMVSCRPRTGSTAKESLVETGPVNATPFIVPPIECPPTFSADEVDIPGDSMVVGVVVNGHARAYLLTAMAPPTHHVVNDLIADVPVSITYCDKTGCVRAFTDKPNGKPLKMNLMGFANGLLLRVGDKTYEQKSGRPFGSDSELVIPFDDLPFEVLNWSEWKKLHPNTDIFVGNSGAAKKTAEIKG